jgi:hypothetical protein
MRTRRRGRLVRFGYDPCTVMMLNHTSGGPGRARCPRAGNHLWGDGRARLAVRTLHDVLQRAELHLPFLPALAVAKVDYISLDILGADRGQLHPPGSEGERKHESPGPARMTPCRSDEIPNKLLLCQGHWGFAEVAVLAANTLSGYGSRLLRSLHLHPAFPAGRDQSASVGMPKMRPALASRVVSLGGWPGVRAELDTGVSLDSRHVRDRPDQPSLHGRLHGRLFLGALPGNS